MIASAYGWRKQAIFEDVYFLEALEYVEMIQRAKMQDYLMHMYIVQNPHTKDPKKMIEMVQAQLDNLAGVTRYEVDADAKAEKGAFDKLKAAFGQK